MTVTLDTLAAEIGTLLREGPPDAVADRLCTAVSRALTDPAFVARHLPDRSAGEPVRIVLHEDPALGFCICGHVHDDAAKSGPHDHGPTWAIYGQAAGTTEMTDWRIVEPGSGDAPSLVEPVRTYVLRPGDAHYYAPGAVHSPRREAPTRLIRVEGANLDRVKRSKIRAR
jgi:hypothetical protein